MRLPTTSTAPAAAAAVAAEVDATKWQRARARQVNLIVQKMANFPRRPTAAAAGGAANAGGTSRSVCMLKREGEREQKWEAGEDSRLLPAAMAAGTLKYFTALSRHLIENVLYNFPSVFSVSEQRRQKKRTTKKKHKQQQQHLQD